MSGDKGETRGTLGHRLRKLRGRQSREQFAAALGIHKNTLARYEMGERKPDAAFIGRVCEYCDVTPDWLLTGNGRSRRNGDVDDYYPPSTLPSEGAAPVMLHQQWLEKVKLDPRSLLVTTMAGDNMVPTLHDGDILLVSREGNGRRREGVHLLELDGAPVIRRVRRIGSRSLQLLNDNAGYPPVHLPATDVCGSGRCRLIGRVVWQLRRV